MLATVPSDLVLVLLPDRYADSLWLLPLLAAAGLGYAGVTTLVTLLLGTRAYRRSQLGLLVATVLLSVSMLVGWQQNELPGLAAGAAAGALLAVVVSWLIAAPLLPPGSGRRVAGWLSAGGVLLLLLQLVRSSLWLWLWLAMVAVAGVVVLSRLRRRTEAAGTADGVPSAPTSVRIAAAGQGNVTAASPATGSREPHPWRRRLARRPWRASAGRTAWSPAVAGGCRTHPAGPRRPGRRADAQLRAVGRRDALRRARRVREPGRAADAPGRSLLPAPARVLRARGLVVRRDTRVGAGSPRSCSRSRTTCSATPARSTWTATPGRSAPTGGRHEHDSGRLAPGT